MTRQGGAIRNQPATTSLFFPDGAIDARDPERHYDLADDVWLEDRRDPSESLHPLSDVQLGRDVDGEVRPREGSYPGGGGQEAGPYARQDPETRPDHRTRLRRLADD